MPVDERDDRNGEAGRELAGEAERNAAELAELQATLEGLRQLRGRIAQRQLEPDDWALFLALLDETTETM